MKNKIARVSKYNFFKTSYVIKKLGRFIPKLSRTVEFWKSSSSFYVIFTFLCQNINSTLLQNYRLSSFTTFEFKERLCFHQCTIEHTWRDSYLKIPSWINFFQVVWTLSKCQSNQPNFVPTLLAIFWNYFYIRKCNFQKLPIFELFFSKMPTLRSEMGCFNDILI